MTIKEQPVLTEEPVRFPHEIKKSAFFLFHENVGFLYHHRRYARVPNPLLRNSYILDLPSFFLYPLLGIALLYGMVHPLQMPMGAAFLLFPFCTLLTFLLLTSWVRESIGNYKTRSVNNRFYSNEGTIGEGTLVSIVGSHPSSRDARYYVEAQYSYVNPVGETRHASVKTERPELKGMPLAESGTPVYILYFNDDETYLL